MATAKKKTQNGIATQPSLFDSLLSEIDGFAEGMSSKDLKAALSALNAAYNKAARISV